MSHAPSPAVPTAKSELLRKLQRLEVASTSTPQWSSDDVDDRACVPLSLAVSLAAVRVTSMTMLSLSSSADEAEPEEGRRLDAEMAADVDWRKPSSGPHVPPSELGCWSDRRPRGQPNDGNVTNDLQHVELEKMTKLRFEIARSMHKAHLNESCNPVDHRRE